MNIIGLSGKRESGKSSSANFLVGLQMLSVKQVKEDGNLAPVIIDWFKINDTGKLIVPTREGEEGIFDIRTVNPNTYEFLSTVIWPVVKIYSFAQPLKEFAVNVLGLDPSLVYGSNEDKDTKTKYRFENLPIEKDYIFDKEKNMSWKPKKGLMTVREVLQAWGSILRSYYDDVWAESAIRRIKAEESELAIIDDLRYENELKCVHDAGGKVIRLTRTIHKDDQHRSETDLDADKFDWTKFDFILDNKDMSLHEQNTAIHDKLKEWKFIEYESTIKDGKVS